MKAKITNSLNQNAMPTWRFGTLMVFISFLFLGFTTFAQGNGQYILGYPFAGIEGSSSESEQGKTPFQCQTKDSRNQYLYYGQELLGNSARGGWITSLAFKVTKLPYPFNSTNSKMYNVTISLALTNIANLTGAIEPTNVYLTIPELAISSKGWVTFDLTTGAYPNGFWWPGNDLPYYTNNNIVVEICQNSWAKPSYPVSGSIPYNFEVQSSTFNSYYVNNNYFTSDYFDNLPIGSPGLTAGCSMTSTSPGTSTVAGANQVRPDVQFTFACSGTPVPGTPAPNATLKKCVGDVNTLEVPNGDHHSGLDYQWESSTNSSVWNDVFGETGETYAIVKADIDMWYRRRTSCGGGSDVYSAAFFIPQKTWDGTQWTTSTGLATTPVNSQPSTTETAVIAGNYLLTSNRTFCSIIVKSGVVSISSTMTLTISQKEVKVTGGSLTFQNNASLIQANAAAVNSGDVTFIRNTTPVTRYDYTYWSSPVKDLKLKDFSPDTRVDKYYSWDQVGQNWFQENAATTKMTLGKGYIIRAPDTFAISGPGVVWPGNFIGPPNNGTITVPVSGSSDPLVEKWNLIGNPYPSAINAIAFFNANSTLLNGTFYFWTHNSAPSSLYLGNDTYNYNTADYASFNKTGPSTWSGTGATTTPNNTAPTGYIASGQSFMIKGIANGNVTFANTLRQSANNTNFYKTSNSANEEGLSDGDELEDENKSRVWLEYLNENGGFKQLLVGYLDGATPDYDNGYDGDIMGGSSVDFFSIIKDHQLGIQGKGLPFDDEDTVPLGFIASVEGNNTLALVNYDGLFDNQDVYLEDRYLNVIHNLKESNYTFVSEKGTFLDRFVLRYTENSLNLKPIPISANSIVAFNKSGNLVVNAGNSIIQSIKVYDLSGRLVLQKKNCQSTNIVVDKPNWNAQLMLVKIITEDKVEVTRKVLF